MNYAGFNSGHVLKCTQLYILQLGSLKIALKEPLVPVTLVINGVQSKATTIVSNPQRPTDIKLWDQLLHVVNNYIDSLEDRLVEPFQQHSSTVDCEEALETSIEYNVLDVLKSFSVICSSYLCSCAIPHFFRPSPLRPIIGRPSFVFSFSSGHVAFLTVVPFSQSLEDLSSSALYILKVLDYLQANHASHAVVTNYYQWRFCRLEGSILYVSPLIRFNAVSPSILEFFVTFLHLAGTSSSSSDDEPMQKQKQKQKQRPTVGSNTFLPWLPSPPSVVACSLPLPPDTLQNHPSNQQAPSAYPRSEQPISQV